MWILLGKGHHSFEQSLKGTVTIKKIRTTFIEIKVLLTCLTKVQFRRWNFRWKRRVSSGILTRSWAMEKEFSFIHKQSLTLSLSFITLSLSLAILHSYTNPFLLLFSLSFLHFLSCHFLSFSLSLSLFFTFSLISSLTFCFFSFYSSLALLSLLLSLLFFFLLISLLLCFFSPPFSSLHIYNFLFLSPPLPPFLPLSHRLPSDSRR